MIIILTNDSSVILNTLKYLTQLLIFTNANNNMQSNVTQKYSFITFGTHVQTVYLYQNYSLFKIFSFYFSKNFHYFFFFNSSFKSLFSFSLNSLFLNSYIIILLRFPRKILLLILLKILPKILC